MNAWSNIQVSPDDPEIIRINNLEQRLGELTADIARIRELITRFEVCHFKYQQHLTYIKKSIHELRPAVVSDAIGIYHIKHGESVLTRDKSGRSLIGQQYVWALKVWLDDIPDNEISVGFDENSGMQIQRWLGKKIPDKIRLVRLLLARLAWDWDAYARLKVGGEFEEIEYQVSRMDICHYDFPSNLDRLLKGLGELKAVDESEFEGCGTYNAAIKANLEKAFIDLNDTIASIQLINAEDKNTLIRIWLVACLAKTIKENMHIPEPLKGLDYGT